MSGWKTTQNQTAVIHIQNLARLPREPHQAADRQHPGVLDAGPLLGGLHAGHLRPCHHRRTAQGGANDGEHPIPCGIDLSASRSRWGQRLGQKKAVGENNNLCKTKRPETIRFRVFLARREGFEPPAFWSVAAGISSWAISSCPTCNLQNPCIFNGFTGFSAQTSRQPCICNRPENSNSVRKVLEISLLLS